MKYLSWVRFRVGRFLLIFVAFIVYCFLLTIGGLRFFPSANANAATLASFWFFLGFSALISLMFLAVGSLVWLFARDRRVALLLFCSSFTMMMTFCVEIGSVKNDVISSIIGGVSSLFSLAFFAVFLLLFPGDYLSRILSKQHRHLQPLRYHLVRAYLLTTGILFIPAAVGTIFHYLRPLFADFLYDYAINFYALFVLVGIIVTIIIAYRGLPTLRERQQIRLFVGGVVLAFVPFLFLTSLPELLNLPSRYVIDGQISTLSAILLPLALGYSILRYQILVFDMYIRRIVAWVVGVVSLIVLGYVAVMFTSLAAWSNDTVHILVVALFLLVLAPIVWWLAHIITERLFFNEISHYRHLIEKPVLLARETLDIDESARLLTLAIVHAFEIDEVCLYTLDQESGYYQLTPELHMSDQHDAARQRLAQLLLTASMSAANAAPAHGETSFNLLDGLPERLALFRNVDIYRRPLLLSEATRAEGDLPTGLARYLSTSALVENDPLLVPVRAQGKMIGLLVLGARSDGQQYAGPDFEVIELLLGRFAPLLETARLYREAHRHDIALRDAYEKLKELDKLKDQFIMTASHELRTPLTAVQGYIELLHNYNERLSVEERATFIAKAQRGCDELTLMVGNIMDSSRVEVDIQEVVLTGVPLAASVAHVLEIMEGVTRRENRRVELDISEDIMVLADGLRLRQIILNVIGNALKYSAAGSPLEITADTSDQMTTLRIRDYGQGVLPVDQERLFERFVRLERDMNSPVRGAGLGLAI
ncbi:MAG TPA: HAMP domain-containing sensor histidine kinase, partial [Ktedonobacteraceae bacterium]|nr:HAMP domain-containing sensor histidine kinase [Ktedonobacteraceae bacterium]